MHYLLKPLIRTLHKMNDSELKLAIIGGMLFSLAGLLDLLRLLER
jgi:Kef-type K+ transport system membrane component KefB